MAQTTQHVTIEDLQDFKETLIGVHPDNQSGIHSTYIIVNKNDTNQVINTIHFQDQPTANGLNGINDEDLIQVLVHRFTSFMNSPLACEEIAVALEMLQTAMDMCYKRMTRSQPKQQPQMQQQFQPISSRPPVGSVSTMARENTHKALEQNMETNIPQNPSFAEDAPRMYTPYQATPTQPVPRHTGPGYSQNRPDDVETFMSPKELAQDSQNRGRFTG